MFKRMMADIHLAASVSGTSVSSTAGSQSHGNIVNIISCTCAFPNNTGQNVWGGKLLRDIEAVVIPAFQSGRASSQLLRADILDFRDDCFVSSWRSTRDPNL